MNDSLFDRLPDQLAPGVGPNFARAHKAWGGDMPDWVEALAKEVDRTSQTDVARRLGYSHSVVSQVLGRSYKGRMDLVAEKVRGALLNATVECPVLGELKRDRCITIQQRKFSTANPTHVQLYRACRRGCPNYRPTAPCGQGGGS